MYESENAKYQNLLEGQYSIRCWIVKEKRTRNPRSKLRMNMSEKPEQIHPRRPWKSRNEVENKARQGRRGGIAPGPQASNGNAGTLRTPGPHTFIGKFYQKCFKNYVYQLSSRKRGRKRVHSFLEANSTRHRNPVNGKSGVGLAREPRSELRHKQHTQIGHRRVGRTGSQL